MSQVSSCVKCHKNKGDFLGEVSMQVTVSTGRKIAVGLTIFVIFTHDKHYIYFFAYCGLKMKLKVSKIVILIVSR